MTDEAKLVQDAKLSVAIAALLKIEAGLLNPSRVAQLALNVILDRKPVESKPFIWAAL